MSKVKELKYPDECVNCKTDACSICEHRQKRSDAIDKYNNQFKEKCPICRKPLKKKETLRNKEDGKIIGYNKLYECGYTYYSAILL